MSKILCSVCAYDQGKSGISEYINGVISELQDHHEVDLIVMKGDLRYLPFKQSDKLKFIVFPEWLQIPIINMLWHLFVLPFLIDFSKYEFIFLPAGNRRVFCRYPVKTIVTMHDLSQFHIEGKYDPLRMFYIKKVIPLFLKGAHKIVSISECTKRDLIKYYNIAADKIVVNHNGFTPLDGVDGNDIVELNDYFLYVSRIEHPGKNHLNLIKAYELLDDDIRQRHKLVFAGVDWDRSEVVHNYLASSSVKDNVIFLGFVEKSRLFSLYSNASLYLFPSFYEGFGIPLLEAMSLGVPILCSNTSSLPEVGGDAVVLFDPDSPTCIATAIERTVADKNLTNKLVKKGKERARSFSWSNHVRRIEHIMGEL